MFAVSSSAFGQDSPARFSPPVHVQPASWSVLEEDPAAVSHAAAPVASSASSATSATARSGPHSDQARASRSNDIANMAQYMRMQNQAVTSAKESQVNAALSQLQYSQLTPAQRQFAGLQFQQQQQYQRQQFEQQRYQQQQYAQQQRYEQQQQYERQQAQQQAQQQQQQIQPPVHIQPDSQNQQPRNLTPPRFAAQQSQPQQQAQQRPAEQQFAQRQVIQRRPVERLAIQQADQRRGIGLQDRISNAMKTKFSRPQPTYRARPRVAHQGHTHGRPTPAQHVGHVSHVAQPASVPTHAEAQVNVPRGQRTQRARDLEYRSESNENDRVVVPSFIEPGTESTSELKLTSGQETIGSGLRRPRVSSHSQPMRYGTRVAQRDGESVFQKSSSGVGVQDLQDDSDEIERLKEELQGRRNSSSDNELPQRPDEDEPSLLDLDDEDTEEAARRARSKLDAELDALEDDEPEDIDDIDDIEDDLDLDDDDATAPVFDERGCEELRGLLLDKSIRDISLDLSPPASPRRNEIASLSRSWTDASGNVLATGTMVDLRRGYVILDSGQKLSYSKLSVADWNAIADNWLLPSVCSIGNRGSLQRNWAPQTVSWHATSLCHKPLYFENVQLERYGHSRGPFMQPIHSTFHFFRSLAFLSYNRAINPANECQYALGYYRPGSCAPWLIDPIPFSRQGIIRQATSTIGLSFIP